MKIGIDTMGGDFAPFEAIKGAKNFLNSASSDVHIVLIGDEDKIKSIVEQEGIDKTQYTIFHAPETIGMHEHPTKALKEKPKSTINVGFQLLQRKKIHAFISAGNTGAMMVGMHYTIKTIEGIQRPTIFSVLPRMNTSTPGLLMDVGINADCKPENLLQFGILGSLFSKSILQNSHPPKVALLNIGEEEGKGNKLAQAAYPLLKENDKINFIGNIEGRDIFTDKADVIVCDGFTGNIVLKLSESFYDITQKLSIKDDYIDLFNFEDYGGTPVLGASEPVIVGHGISKANAFSNMIESAETIIRSRLLDTIRDNFSK
ncbi:MAG TPA: phosphate acyltransferase PlsX [Chitinophagaceae bacterium]|nr:phosphate acyltransferase PlsX [Chitinophagaceae bacterium]